MKGCKEIEKKNLFLSLYLLLFLFFFSSCPAANAHHNPTFGFAGTAGPILTSPATTIPKGHWGVGIRTEYVNFNEFSNDALKYFAKKKEFIHSGQYFLSPSIGAAYGVTDNFTFALRLPYSIQGNITDGLLSKTGMPYLSRLGTSDGLGDITFFTQYRFLNLKDKAFEAALLSGITIPSGLAHVKDKHGDRFGADHQPSKRAFEPLVGLALSKRFGHKLSIDSNYLFTKAVRGIQRFYPGDLHNYNVALSYRFLEQHHHHHQINEITKEGSYEHLHEHQHEHHYAPPIEEYIYEHSHRHKHKWYSIFGADAVVELNGEWRQKQEFGTRQPFGFKDENNGGHFLYLSPGLRLAIGEKWATYVSFGLPVIATPMGKGQRPDFRMIFGVSRSF